MDYNEFRERYQYDPVNDLVGQGGFGRVYRARDLRLDRSVALKVFSRDVPQQYDLISEIKRAIRLNHPNICRYFDAEVLRGINALGEPHEIQVGVMEYVQGGTIDQFLRTYPQYRQKLLLDILRGLSYLHQHQPPIIHRDLKPSNVLVDWENGVPVAKITDFGISKTTGVSGTGLSMVGLGTYAYMAPEQLNPARYGVNGKIQCNLDLWSFGAMTIELLTGALPFSAGDPEVSTGQILESIIRGIPPEQLNRFDEPYRTLLRLCMVQEAGKRAQSAADLLPILDPSLQAQSRPASRSADPIGIEPLSKARQRDELRLKHRYPLVLYPSRGKLAMFLLGSLLLTGGGIWAAANPGSDDPTGGYVLTALGAICSLCFLILLFPGTTFLRLDEMGFSSKTVVRGETHNWRDIAQFFVIADRGVVKDRKVGWNFRPGYQMKKSKRTYNRTYLGCDGALPDNYGKSAQELAELMNECLFDAQELE